MNKQKICIAPLDWGLGHATRCIHLAKSLMQLDYQIYIASEGYHEVILREALPEATFLPLAGYRIQYSKDGKWFLLKMLAQIPKMLFSIYYERNWLRKMQQQFQFDIIISDNRFGVYSINVPSVYLTHQLHVFSGFFTSWLSSKAHQKIIKKHQECWIPDFENNPNLSGKLGHIKACKLNLKYVGPLSRFTKTKSSDRSSSKNASKVRY